MSNVAKILLAGLRRRGFILSPGPDWQTLFAEPFSRLSEADRTALKEHREAILDLLWGEAHPSDDRAIGWPEPLTQSQLRGVCVPWTEEDYRLVASQKVTLR